MKCRTKFCRKLAFPSGKSPYCAKCRTRHWRERHPVSYFYNKLKQRAKERGHEFSLTREQFEFFWKQKGLNSGKTKLSLSFHRIRNEEGYHFGNIKVLTLSENSRLKYVPYFKHKADEEAAIAETSREIKELMAAGLL